MSNVVEISFPNLTRLNNDEFAQFLKVVVKLVSTATIEKLAIKEELFSSIQTQLDLLTEASRQSRISQESENINRLDKQRSEMLAYLISSFKLERKNPIASRQEAGNALFKEFKNYSGAQTLPTRQKSQAIDAMLKDLEKPENVKHTKTLGLAQVITSLKESNTSYQELVGVRAESQISVPIIKVKEVRKETNALFKELVQFSYANDIINPSAESNAFVRSLNKLFSDTMTAYKQRAGQMLAAKTPKEPEKENPPVEEQK